MKIVVPVAGEYVNDHFGHCNQFMIFYVDDNKNVIDTELLPWNDGCGCRSNIAGVLKEKDVSVALVGGLGRGALTVLESNGITVLTGASGNVYTLINDFLKGNFETTGGLCNHHSHDGHHQHHCNHID
jgi:predicted Fe-Mo cluster-binding NifX family protein